MFRLVRAQRREQPGKVVHLQLRVGGRLEEEHRRRAVQALDGGHYALDERRAAAISREHRKWNGLDHAVTLEQFGDELAGAAVAVLCVQQLHRTFRVEQARGGAEDGRFRRETRVEDRARTQLGEQTSEQRFAFGVGGLDACGDRKTGSARQLGA